MAKPIQIVDQAHVSREEILALGNGRHALKHELGGAKIYATVENGVVVGYEAERDGVEVESFILHKKASGPKTTLRNNRVDCYLCACSGDSCTCRPYPCPGGGI